MEDAATSTGNGRKRPRNDNSINNNNISSAAGGRGGGGGGGGGGRRSHHQNNGRGGGRHRTENHARRTVRQNNNNNHGAVSMNTNRNDNNAQRKQQQQQQQQNIGSQQRSNNRSARLEENDRNLASTKTKTLPWPNPHSHYIPLQEEERLLPSLLHWGKSERGMMKDQPPFRLKKIQKLLLGDKHKNNNNNNNHRCMTLLQSLSLRRTHLKHLQPRLSMPQLKLGSEADIRHSAALFEQVVQNYLRRYNVLHCFWTEEDQRRMSRKRGGRMPPSPDFRVRDGHNVQLDFDPRRGGKKSATNQSPSTTINWIEAKMFYGASTIPTNTPNAVGAILPKMNEYVSLYGAGAIVFMYGCGDVLARQLLDIGVVALDGRGLDVTIVEESQRSWCADARGTILF